MVLLRVLIPLPRNQGEVSEEIFHFQLVNQKKKKKQKKDYKKVQYLREIHKYIHSNY